MKYFIYKLTVVNNKYLVIISNYQNDKIIMKIYFDTYKMAFEFIKYYTDYRNY